MAGLKYFIKRYAPRFLLKQLNSYGIFKGYSEEPRVIDKGHFDRLSPFSQHYGYDRGGPIDRFYIEQFLENHSGHIKGSVLEIGDNDYTIRFGGKKVTKSDVLNVEESKAATIVGDLSNAPHIKDESFDCILLNQTLHLIYDYKAALQTCKRILKPGGVLLLTVPGISFGGYHEWSETWYWSYTSLSIRTVLKEVFLNADSEVENHGNVLIATAYLYGMGLPELKRDQLHFNDPHYQLIITAKVTK